MNTCKAPANLCLGYLSSTGACGTDEGDPHPYPGWSPPGMTPRNPEDMRRDEPPGSMGPTLRPEWQPLVLWDDQEAFFSGVTSFMRLGNE